MLHYANINNNGSAIILALLMTVILGYISYRLIENSSRTHLNAINTKQSVILFFSIICIIAVPAKMIKKLDGIPSRLPENITRILTEANNKNPRMKECHMSGTDPVPECTYGGDTLGAIVIGDSHAASLVRAVEKSLPTKELYVLDWTLSACSTIKGLKKRVDKDYRCSEFIDYALTKQKKLDNNTPFIIVNRLSMTLEGLNKSEGEIDGKQPEYYLKPSHQARDEAFYQDMTAAIVETACQLAESRPVYMLRPTPEFPMNVPQFMARNALIYKNITRAKISRLDYQTRHRRAIAAQDIAATQCGIHILDPVPYLCDAQYCYGDQDGHPIYYDDDHLNERGSQLLQPLLEQVFAEQKKHQA